MTSRSCDREMAASCRFHGQALLFFLGLLVFACLVPVHTHAATPLTVTVTATPSSLAPGGSATLLVTVTINGIPVRDSTVSMSSGDPAVSFTSASGTTDSTGVFVTTLITTSSVQGIIRVRADASFTPFATKYLPEASYGGGYTDLVITSPEVPQQGGPSQQQGAEPVGIITVERNPGAFPLTIRFDGTGSFDPDGSINDYSWSYGDGTTGSGYISSHTYSNPGSYTASLTVTDNEGLRSLPVTIVITAWDAAAPPDTAGLPVAVIEVNQSYGPPPLAVAFDGTKSSNPGGSISEWQWDFGDGKSARGSFTTHTYLNSGSYSSTLRVMGADGLSSDFSTIQIIVKTSPSDPGTPNIPSATPQPTPVISRNPGTSSYLKASTLAESVRTAAGQPVGPPFLASFIPAGMLPLLAVVTGTVVAVIAASFGEDVIKKYEERLTIFFRNLVTSESAGLASKIEIEKRGIHPSEQVRKTILGISPHEWVVIGASALGFSAAFILQNHLSIDVLSFIIFFCTGALVVIFHDFGHRMMAYRIGRRGEFQFWGLGAATMLSTAWLFGTAFAKPSRTVIGAETGPPGDAKTDALIQLAGPMVNLIAAGISLVLIPLGGFFALAGSAGFSLNLLSYVYGMLPIMPMEGKTVYDWNRGIWAGIFFPLLLVYLWLFMV